MRKRVFLPTAFFIVFATIVKAQQNNGQGSIKGSVITNDNKPASSVTIFLTELKKSAVADDDGKFVLHNIPAGNYTIEVSLVGYETATQTVNVQADKTSDISLHLKLSEKQLQEVIVTSNNKYKSTKSDYANKMSLSYLENAQSYTTVTKDLIKDQVLFTVDDAMRNVSGLQKMWDATGRAGDGGAYYDLRGFAMQTTMRNGLASMITTTTDAANIEKVEILKGPSATLYGSSLTSFGGLINRVTKKPYDHFGGEVNVSGGSYKFFRGSADINTPVDKARKIMFRFNGAYNTQGSFQQVTGTGNRFFVAPSLLIKPNDKLSISLDADLTYSKSVPNQFMFLYFTAADLGFDNAGATGLDYKNSYVGVVNMHSRSANYFANGTYKISDKFTSSTNVSYSRSWSNGHNQYFFQVPDYLVTGNPDDIGTPSVYLARADQSTRNSRNDIFEAQQYFNSGFNIGNLKNRAVLGLDFTNINSNQNFYSQYTYIDVVPTNVNGFDYSTFNNAAIEHFYDTANAALVQTYPLVSKTSIYSAFISDVLNITDNLDVIAALRLDHFYNHDIAYSTSYNQTTLSPKFGLVYQPVKNQLSLFANYQNSFTNQGSYIAYDPSAKDSLVSKFAKPEHANQWEAGVKTNLIKNKLTATFSYYHIKVDDALRSDPRDPAAAQIQNGTQLSKGVELEILSNPLKGFTVLGGIAYNDFSYENTSDDIEGFRYSGAPWLANWWLSYQFDNALKGFHIGFGGNYAGKNDIQNSPAYGEFYLPAYTVLNASVGYDAKKYSIAVKVDNLNNEHYWQGYTTYNPQMLRQFVGSVSYKF
ncbi:MAG TPA: TonB-dependent receptor [Chitinophagaceae bacterium]|nr:TonB-dependent receptor [Chitinophagaceae bacterium]